MLPRALRPQLKRDPLGGRHAQISVRSRTLEAYVSARTEVPPRRFDEKPVVEVTQLPRPTESSDPQNLSRTAVLAWEYHHVRQQGDEPVLGKAELDALGAEGWELTAVVSGSGGLHFYFKRSKRAPR